MLAFKKFVIFALIFPLSNLMIQMEEADKDLWHINCS